MLSRFQLNIILSTCPTGNPAENHSDSHSWEGKWATLEGCSRAGCRWADHLYISTASIVEIKSICKAVFVTGSSVMVPMFSIYHSLNCFNVVAKSNFSKWLLQEQYIIYFVYYELISCFDHLCLQAASETRLRWTTVLLMGFSPSTSSLPRTSSRLTTPTGSWEHTLF